MLHERVLHIPVSPVFTGGTPALCPRDLQAGLVSRLDWFPAQSSPTLSVRVQIFHSNMEQEKEDVLLSFPYALRISPVIDSGPRTIITLLMRKNSCSLKHKSIRINILTNILDRTKNKNCIKLTQYYFGDHNAY